MNHQNSSILLPVEQINELSHALEIERDLVLKTQENYKKLKMKFLELSEESQSLKLEMETRLLAQSRQIEILEREKDGLKEDNQRLYKESVELKSEIDEILRASKTKENELRRAFNSQIEELLQHTSKAEDDERAVAFEELWRKELLQSEGRVQELLAEIKTIQHQRYEEIHSLEEELRKERQKCIELETTLRRQTADLESVRSLANIRQIKSIDLRSDINHRLKEAMEKEVAWLSKEEDFRKTLTLKTASFEKKVADLERITEEKTNFFGLRRNFEELRDRGASTIAEVFARNNDEEKARLEGKVKSLTSTLEHKEKASCALVEQLERERNVLEMTVAELKKKPMCDPSNSDELQCLRKVVEEKEKQLTSVTRRYRQLVRQVETSLSHLEKQQRETSNKLEQTIIPSFIQNLTI
ncbi:hypothetical protein KIN20_020565 [Parelaphostrongylus tenuis]|uniref:Uncharacterized protein n=1 Tax=Parelaphostrongylus tenuis TaxID=148309 RepID=A0AAD5QQZ2_PARTN|nr:hypothetical protein KIN20_020565 [Parelaphostrongylus tenuis]